MKSKYIFKPAIKSENSSLNDTYNKTTTKKSKNYDFVGQMPKKMQRRYSIKKK